MSKKKYFTHITSPGVFEFESSIGGVTTCYKLDNELNRIPMKKIRGKGFHTNVDGSDAYEMAIIRTVNLKRYYINDN